MVGESMGNDQYCLRWNSYETNILATFEGLLDSEALSDVTLFCEGESFKAHRLVLAACSTHFAKLFGSSPLNGQIIVILDGTRSQDLQILLQFMYRGVAYLHQDRIDSVLRTAEVLQVKGLSDGHTVENVTNDAAKPPPAEGGAPYMSPPREPLKKDQAEGGGGLEMDVDRPPERDTSPRPSGPSGRIAAADSPLPHQRSPIFPPPQGNYTRPPFTSIASTFYQQFASTGGFARPDNKPTSTSFAAPNKSELPSQGPSRDTSQYGNFNPLQREERERDRDGHYDGPGLNIREGDRESPNLPKRSPPGTHRRPSSAEYDQRSPRLIQSDSTTDAPGASPSSIPRPPYPEETEQTRPRHGEHVNIKTESNSTGDVSPRPHSYSGEFQGPRGEERRTSGTPGTAGTGRVDDMPMNLRTNDQEERLKRETNLETLRRIAAANAANSERENQLATIQKMDLLRQANQGRDPFLGGNFQIPLTAPLGIPASDLARIATSVQDPSCTGTNSSGTKLKCPFCERTYGYETNLRAHIRQRHQGIRVPCPFCHRSFTRNNTVRRHIAREHRHQINPKMIPAKFGSTKVLPDAPFQEHLNKHAGQP